MKIAVVGTGYVGLVAGACFADTGNQVWCVDIDEAKVEALRRGEIPIYEPGLDPIVKRNIREERIHFTTDLTTAVEQATVIFLAVGTPPLPDGSADLSQVLAASRSIGDAMNGKKFVVNKSTVPLGTSDVVKAEIEARTSHPVVMVSNPEFLKEGTAVEDFVRPDRVVIGTDDDEAREVMSELYSPFVRNTNPVLMMDLRSAELTKYASNSMLALRISFMNELSRLADAIGANIDVVRRGMGTDVRIGKHFLFAGAGYGGSCFPKDVKALVQTGQKHGTPLSILEAADAVNEEQKRILFQKMHAFYKGDLAGKTFGIWGLAFKPNTDDMREAPAIVLIRELLEAGATVKAYDPVAMGTARGIFGDSVELVDHAFAAVADVDALAIVTEWNEFRSPDLVKLRDALSGNGAQDPVIFDGRNVFDPAKIRKQGFTYLSIGRP